MQRNDLRFGRMRAEPLPLCACKQMMTPTYQHVEAELYQAIQQLCAQ